MIEIWIAGRKLCETEKDNGAVIKGEEIGINTFMN